MATTFFENLKTHLEEAGIGLNSESQASTIVSRAEEQVEATSGSMEHSRGCTHNDHKNCSRTEQDGEYQEDLPESPRFSR